MYRIDHVDQLYYLLDNDTLLGRQIPIAIVAFRPERVPVEPVAFWDYGAISEICPTSELCVLGDSDDFLMMELRTHRTMAGWLKLGWMQKDEIARSLSLWMTEDQRRCGEHPLVVHRRDLPANFDAAEAEIDAYYRDVMRRVSGEPRDYREHYIWTGAIEGHQEWLQSRDQSSGSDAAAPQEARDAESFGAALVAFLKSVGRALVRGSAGGLYRQIYHLLRAIHLRLFGRLPDVRWLHPHYADLRPVMARVAELAAGARRGLAVWTIPNAAIAPNLSRWVKDVANTTPDEITNDSTAPAQPYDFCFLELSREEFAAFGVLHARLREWVRPGGHIVVLCRLRGMEQVLERDFQLISGALPDRDVAVLRLRGGLLSYIAQRTWDRVLANAVSGRARDLLALGAISALLSPVTLVGNWRALRRDSGRFTGFCTSMVLEITVV